MLPKIDMGDLLIIHDTGAHGTAMGYNYNGGCAPPKCCCAGWLPPSDPPGRDPRDYFATLDVLPQGRALLEHVAIHERDETD